jgi:hypothetical protein
MNEASDQNHKGKILCTAIRGPGLFAIDVVGENFYRANLESILRSHDFRLGGIALPDEAKPLQISSVQVQAMLVSEPDNSYDPNAIAVLVDSLKVGYLDRAMASRVTKALKRDGYVAIRASCQAKIVGAEGENDSFRCGVKLDIYTKSQLRSERELSGQAEFSFLVTKPTDNAHPGEELAFVGNQVKFWSNPNAPQNVNIYCQGGMLGSGLLGKVPPEHVLPIIRHLNQGLSIQARITKCSDDGWTISCRLVSQEETDEANAKSMQERHERLQRDLAKPYRPQKPFFISLAVEGIKLSSGGGLTVVALPDLDVVCKQHGPLEVTFSLDQSGVHFTAKIERGTVEKLIRLAILPYKTQFRVVKHSGKSSGMDYFLAQYIKPT